MNEVPNNRRLPSQVDRQVAQERVRAVREQLANQRQITLNQQAKDWALCGRDFIVALFFFYGMLTFCLMISGH